MHVTCEYYSRCDVRSVFHGWANCAIPLSLTSAEKRPGTRRYFDHVCGKIQCPDARAEYCWLSIFPTCATASPPDIDGGGV